MEYKSPAFSDFRHLMDLWDEALEKEKNENEIETMLNSNHFVFFFKKGDKIFAGPEESRLTFANMKHPDDDTDEAWVKEASFSGIDLGKALEGERSESLFSE